MKQIINFIGSLKIMAILMLVFAISIGYATFVENDFGTMSAKAEVFNSRWFEILLAFLGINLLINIVNFKMARNGRWFVFIFHVAFLIILAGAAITRYVGYEGVMHIREGESSDTIVSSEPFVSIDIIKDGKVHKYKTPLYLSKRGGNEFYKNISFDGESINVNLTDYIPNATHKHIASATGEPFVLMMVSTSSGAKEVELSHGEYIELDDVVLDFNSTKVFSKPVIKISVKDKKLFMSTPISLATLSMDTQEKKVIEKGDVELASRVLYQTFANGFVLKEFIPVATMKIQSDKSASNSDGVSFDISYKNETKNIIVMGESGALSKPSELKLDDLTVLISYGSIEYKTPFAIRLNKFELERYPGSMSPSSYASEVTLNDTAKQTSFDFRIFMNHVLDYNGYRFFQSSYDMDEKGTVLSVNRDPGTFVTYIGYTLLTIGMFGVLFTRSNRFAALRKKLDSLANAKIATMIIAVFMIFSHTNLLASDSENIVIKTAKAFDRDHAQKFSKLIVQDSSGRMKPMDTLSREIVTKIGRTDSFLGLDANQIVLGMMIRPEAWREIAIVRTNDPEINKIIGADEKAKNVAFSQFFEFPDELAGYKLATIVEEASRKPANKRNKLDKALLQVDERVNITYMVFTGELVRMWPRPNDKNHKWDATIEAIQTLEPKGGEIVRALAQNYFYNIDRALESGDWSQADDALEKISKYQKFEGASVILTDTKRDFEIYYNKVNIFERLWPLYFIVGFVLLVFSMVAIVKPKFNIKLLSVTSFWLLVLFFMAHTIGLMVRWYIAGHAPWSDGYESMIYIGWATVLAGFIFSHKSVITMAATSILTGLILFVAHLNWMDPQVTNLVPVLQSYWLSIHVSMITASYGFLGLGALLGFINLILFIIKNSANNISISIKELNAINEMSLLIGLVLLTIGNFMGGVWANESWGRYWGWDPKETWALVTILVYAVVVHLRLIKGFYSDYIFSVVSLLAFTSVLMTYFGVNYYLAGLHSYAKGDPLPIPDFVPWTYAVIAIVIAVAFKNRELKKVESIS